MRQRIKRGRLVAKLLCLTRVALALIGLTDAIEIVRVLQANLQNPYDLYRLCQAYQGKGDLDQAKGFCKKAADFNSLPQINYAFIRRTAAKI